MAARGEWFAKVKISLSLTLAFSIDGYEAETAKSNLEIAEFFSATRNPQTRRGHAEKEPRQLMASEAKHGTLLAPLRVQETASIDLVTAT